MRNSAAAQAPRATKLPPSWRLMSSLQGQAGEEQRASAEAPRWQGPHLRADGVSFGMQLAKLDLHFVQLNLHSLPQHQAEQRHNLRRHHNGKTNALYLHNKLCT